MAGQHGDDGLRFTVLGPIRAWRGSRELDLGTPLQRSILALLLLRRGRAVTPAEMIDGIWGEDAPPRALGALRTYVSRLRGVLEPDRSPRSRPELITSVGRGYALHVAEEALDLTRFEQGVRAAEAAQRAGRIEEAAEHLRGALDLWTGEPLAGAVGPHADHQRDRLTERRMAAVETLMDLDLRLGRHREVVSELIALTAEHPLRERLRAQLMLALYRCGRQAEALAVFTETRRVLIDQLGIEPGPELTELHQRILTADPALAPPEPARPAPGGAAVSGAAEPEEDGPAEAEEPTVELPRPAQLPAAVSDFTGRDGPVARLRDLLTGPGEGMPVVAVCGIGGVGKTTLAVHVAHLLADRFPDGQLYADLRGHSGEPLAPETALAAFLRGLGIPTDIIPEGLAERSALFRSLLSDRRILVLLDNAKDAAQVAPLLPGSPGCATIITSRTILADLPAARLIDLDVMEPDEALSLFATVAGPERVAAERAAAMDVVAACGFLPLAVRIVAARLAARPAWTVASLVPRLADERRRLDELRVGNLAVSATFALGYGQLDPAQARAFRLLALPGGPDISVPAAAALLSPVPAAPDPVATEALLESLVDVSLLEAPSAGRYRYHDLLKLFARQQAETTDEPAERERALRRLLDFYLASAQSAHRLAYEGSMIADYLSAGEVPGHTFPSAEEALTWLMVEAENLFAAVGQVAAAHLDRAVPHRDAAAALLPAADLLVAMEPLMDSGAYVREFEERTRALLDAACRAEHLGGQLRCRYVLGRMLFGTNRLPEAEQEFRTALSIAEHTGDRVVTGEILNALAVVVGRLRRHEEALSWYEAARRAYGEIGATAGEGLVLSYSAREYLALRRPADAIRAAERGLAIFTEIGSAAGIARARYHLGVVLSQVGRFTEALAHHTECLASFRASRQRVWEQRVCVRLAETFVRVERFADAVHHAEQALTVSREIGHQYGEAQSYTVLGKALAGLGDTRGSEEALRRAYDLFRLLGVPDADDVKALLARREPES